jgi:HD-GYP domain-containing protein (c-di-GMP phosphodiesterase class II)
MRVLNLQFYFDIFFYLFIFHFTGGTGSPFFILLLFPAISATIVFQPPGSYFRALATLLIFGLALYGETNWHLNPPFLMVISHKEKTILLFIALTGSLFLSVYLTANLVQHLRERLKNLNALQENLKRNYFETVMGLAQAVEAKEPAIKEHLGKSIFYATLIGRRLGLDEESMEHLRFGAVLHDIGKIGIDESILSKPAKLTPEEYEQVKKHPEIGAHIINGVEFLEKVKPVILEHHERYDGEGYPRELKGEEISLLARIMSVVDAYDAMTSDRPYAKAKTREEAIKELAREKGKQFDSGITDMFIEVLQES